MKTIRYCAHRAFLWLIVLPGMFMLWLLYKALWHWFGLDKSENWKKYTRALTFQEWCDGATPALVEFGVCGGILVWALIGVSTKLVYIYATTN